MTFMGKKISIAYDIDYSDLYLRPYLNKKIIPKAIFTAPKKIHRKIIASNANYLFESIKNINQDKIIEYIPLETSELK